MEGGGAAPGVAEAGTSGARRVPRVTLGHHVTLLPDVCRHDPEDLSSAPSADGDVVCSGSQTGTGYRDSPGVLKGHGPGVLDDGHCSGSQFRSTGNANTCKCGAW